MAPSGLAVDVNGHVYAVTGNTDSGGQFDMNDAVLRLSADLGLEDYWAPVDWLTLSRSDTDIGSVERTTARFCDPARTDDASLRA